MITASHTEFLTLPSPPPSDVAGPSGWREPANPRTREPRTRTPNPNPEPPNLRTRRTQNPENLKNPENPKNPDEPVLP